MTFQRPNFYVRGAYNGLRDDPMALSTQNAKINSNAYLWTARLVVYDDVTIDSAIVRVQVAGAVAFQAGIYAASPRTGHALGAPLVQASFSAASTGIKTSATTGGSLTAGVYRVGWMVSAYDAACRLYDWGWDRLPGLMWATAATYSGGGLPTISAGATWVAGPTSPFATVLPMIVWRTI